MKIRNSRITLFASCIVASVTTVAPAFAQFQSARDFSVGAPGDPNDLVGTDAIDSEIEKSLERRPGLGQVPRTTIAADRTPGSSVSADVSGQAYGTGSQKWPYSTARVAVNGVAYPRAAAALVPVASRPYRYTGKLRVRFGATWINCTATVIQKGIVLTSAKCVHNYGRRALGYANSALFYPANYTTGNGGPFGSYQSRNFVIPTYHFAGNDTCETGYRGIVCNNDIAIVTLAPKAGVWVSDAVGGWNGYGWNGYGFVFSPDFGDYTVGQVTQLAYPATIDNGLQMIRNDSFSKYLGYIGSNGRRLDTWQMGSPVVAPGSPWIVNFGTPPSVGSSVILGDDADPNVVIGVSSWRYSDAGENVIGSSFFGQTAEYPADSYGNRGAGNIGAIVNYTCTRFPAYCSAP